jgi:glucosylceramidase
MIRTLAVAGVFSFLTGCTGAEHVEWIQTTASDPWGIKDAIVLADEHPENAVIITLDSRDLRQTIDGFGACFNELGWEALQSVSQERRDGIIRDLFDPDTGCALTICRMPVGANDYAVDWYSLDEVPGDFEMTDFSIDRDRQRLIPYIRAAMAVNPGIRLWASPWSPPSWMKVNGHYACRSDPKVNDLPPGKSGREMSTQFIMDEQTLSAYALYFSKFIHSYREEGIEIYAVHVQNEPNSCQNFPSCIWTPQDLATFIGKYLGPRFETDLPDTEIWLGTIERPQPERIDAVLQDKQAARYVKGVGFQWAGKDAVGEVRKRYPEMKLMETESECGNGSNDWNALEHTFSLMKHYFTQGVESYLYWNMILDESGKSQWGWKQNSLITIGHDGLVTCNPEYYLMKHLSASVRKGARFIGSLDGWENCFAFLNPDHELVLMVLNPESSEQTLSFQLDGGMYLNLDLPAKSLHTLKIPPLSPDPD